jgi:hypothetical protein
MTNADVILAAIREEPGSTDAELRQRTGVEPHQQVNQICRRLEAQGSILRRSRPDGRIGNYAGPSEERSLVAATVPVRVEQTPVRANVSPNEATPTPTDGLLIIPCSGSKAPGGLPILVGPTILDCLTPAHADRLRDARQRLAPAARTDERLLRPAWKRYTGNFYKAADAALAGAVAAGKPLVIVSGGYGLLLATEPVGYYDRQFSVRDWPPSLLEDCLLDLVGTLGMRRVFGFFADTTGYAKLIRNVRWAHRGVEATLAVPQLDGRRGAQAIVPIASGESLTAHLGGGLQAGWQSSAGVRMGFERLS